MCTAGCAVAPQRSDETPSSLPPAAAQSPNDVLAGGKLFSQHCAACHGLDARGGTRGPSLHTGSIQTMPDATLVQFLTDGDLRKGMPSWSRIPLERRRQLARYIKSLPTSNETRRHGKTGS
ncbi:MAG: cytochrome c [Acidobacteriota bacterium]|nr:cytochrome c [Acidobacteriota bacterium]